ncbi:MAG TPA: hypothetical protein VF380_06240 [Solirubrobacteraceae bacterium]
MVLTSGLATGAAQAATGLEPGVHVDPGSPAAKEYALPLNQARQTGGGAPSSSSSSAPLFGAGIKPPGAGGSSHSGSGTGKATGRGGAVGPNGANPAAGLSTLPAAVLRASSAQASSGGGDSILALLGGGVAILVLGGLGGMILRRSRHSGASA